MKRKLASLLFIGICTTVFLFTCKKDKQKDNKPVDNFDRKAMLTNIGNNVIIANYLSLQTEANALDAAVIQFNTTTDSANLANLQTAFNTAYATWQLCSVFELGPGESQLIRLNLNTFPTDTAQINANIASGVYDLGTAANVDAKGLPAIDFLLFESTFITTLANYTTANNATNRKTYLLALSNEIKTKANNIYNAWIASGGNYINTFITNSGTDIGSSLGLLINQLNYDFETIKNFKIGIPLGKKTLGTPLPEKVEGYFSGTSLALVIKHLKTIENIYLGRSELGVDGLGLDDYLTHLKTPYNSGLLSDAIRAQLQTAISKLQSIPSPLSQTVVSNPTVVDAAYIELQKLVVLLKADMPAALGTLITYADNDGD